MTRPRPRGAFARLCRDESAQGLVEYAIIIALVSVIAIVALRILGKHTSSVFECTGQALEHPISAHCGSGGRL